MRCGHSFFNLTEVSVSRRKHIYSGNTHLRGKMKSPPLPSPFSGARALPTTSKRRRLKPPSPSPPVSTFEKLSTPPPPAPVTPPKEDPVTALSHVKTKARTKRSLAPSLSSSPRPAADHNKWEPLHIPRSELSLPLTLPTGQSFRWKKTGPSQYTGVVGPHLLSLNHIDGDPLGHVSYLLHGTAPAESARPALRDYLNLGISLPDMWRVFSDSDTRFAELTRHLAGGVRVLRQDPVECVFQFLCSSNNNIGRIERMVGKISSFGDFLGTVGGFDFHRFPSLGRLSLVSEQQLREAGFGYRAKYIVDTVRVLQAKPGGGAEWLASLRGLELPEVIEALCTLPGVGPKVAACIALFSLDQHHAIPVDTHVWQIAAKYFIPELAKSRPTPKLFGRVSEAFITKFGKYAGWAQTVLFISELPSQRALLPAHLCTVKETKSLKGNHGTALGNR